MKNTIAILAALFAGSAAFAAETTACPSVEESAKIQITKAPENVLELVSKLVAQNEACAGEVVKAAIIATKADKALVGQIVETAATAAPKMTSQIASYAFAIAPDAKPAIVAVLEKISADQGTAQIGRVRVHPLNQAGTRIITNSPNGTTLTGGRNSAVLGGTNPPAGPPNVTRG